ncbi:peptidylprolyl isomerase [Kribbella solani]|uniref:Peptidyl-prolyl cis-trans isomerase n=1 Tax=Kribbella solani TaxID=236067 RepID=A0A841DUT7_9ACTN|nr:peptidylprolyl isomerase [Kribbella solani]MBB5980635.1 peptidyl-prolyl cis-trans isomerase B (cyclophilin B) [Kribbella solani]MDX3002612.1 peptidylprolyl isomerase [Kribbella solani]
MSKKTHQQQLAARKAKRQAERDAEHRRQRRNLAITITAVAAVVVVIVGVFVVVGNGDGNKPAAAGQPSNTPSAADQSAAGPDNKPASIPTALAPAPKRPKPLAAEVSCTYKKSTEPASKKVNLPADGMTKASGTTKVSMNTSIGDLQLTLDSSLAPCAVKNFLSLVGQKYFDNTKCHRLTVGEGLQVLQCGDPTGTGSGGPGYSFNDEVFPTLKYGRGTLAMANAGANTNGSQFFIVYGDASGLTPQYTAFGTIDAPSLKLIDKVAEAGVTPQNGPQDGTPIIPVDIKTATAAA